MEANQDHRGVDLLPIEEAAGKIDPRGPDVIQEFRRAKIWQKIDGKNVCGIDEGFYAPFVSIIFIADIEPGWVHQRSPALLLN